MILQGIDILTREGFAKLKNKSVGLVTNYSFVDRNLNWGIDLMLKAGVKVSKIFTPEHGLGGVADGAEYGDSVHPRYSIPLISLYGEKLKPRKQDMAGLDVLVYDIQGVGLRFYTFIYTLAYTLEAAAENGVEYVVLDRVNPLGRDVFGSRIPDKLQTFVGGYSLPLQYGLTAGELAKYFKKLKNLDLDLSVVTVEGWKGETFEKTALDWNVPSPNIPTFESLLGYAGTCFFEATNVSEGRGTFKPFLVIGAPWIDGFDLTYRLREDFPELKVRRREFVPFSRKYAETGCDGVEFFPSLEDNFFLVTLRLLKHLLEYDRFEVRTRIDDLVGLENTLEKLERDNLDLAEWRESGEEFIEFARDCLLYRGELRYRDR